MIKGLIFDVNGTVSDILTNEGYDDLYRVMANLLAYQGIALTAGEVRRLYFEINRNQRRSSGEEFPEFDVVALFREIIERYGTDDTFAMPKEKLRFLPQFLAEVYRAASRFKLQLYPDVREVLSSLRGRYRMAALSDGQSVWALPELREVGLLEYFECFLISSDLGYRKPDPRMFEKILERMELAASEVLFIGNDMYRDVFGARRLGIKTVFFRSNQGEQRNMGAEPDYIIDHFAQLPEAVRFLEQ